MGEKTAVDAVACVVLQKLEGLLKDESFASNKIIGRLKRMQEELDKTRSSLTKAAAEETNDAEIKILTGEYLGLVYSMEDSIEKFALRFTRRRKRRGFLMNHALFLNKFTALKMLSCKLNNIRTKVKELDRRTSSRKTVESPHKLESENADDDDGKGKVEAADGEQHEVNEGGDDDDGKGKVEAADGEQHEVNEGGDDDDGGDGVAEKMKQISVSSTSKANDGGETMKHAQSSPTTPTTPGKPKHVRWTNPLNVLKHSDASTSRERMTPETLDTLSSRKTGQASDILTLSYNDLDIHLKLCLIYMTLFPKELDIPVRRLQRLWLAEGFVEQKKDKFPEDVAQKHFEDLVKRSLIMVSKQRSDGSPRKCRLPDSLRDLLSAEAQDISLFHVHPGPDCQRADSVSNRRLIEQAGAEPCPLEPSQSQLLRSYISFNFQKKDTPAKYVSSLVSKMAGKGLGLLRVLDLERVYKPSLPENLGDLFHLRYLGLRWTFLDKLPKSVGELPFLETLDLKHTNIDKIPTSIWKLRNLQHLNLHEVHLDKDTPLHFSRSLPKLLTLWGLSVSHESPIKNGLSKLKHLRELGISFRSIKCSDNAAEDSKSTSPAQSTDALVEWISKLKDLRSLRLRSIDDTGYGPADLSLKKSFSELKELSHMKLLGKLQQLPPIIQFPPQIKVLTLSLSYLKEDPMPFLGELTSLTVLRLLGSSYVGNTISCKNGTFKSLEVLKLWVLENLNKWEVEAGAMEKLKEVNIRRCERLENFPSRLLQQETFKELILNDMPTAFKEKVVKECPSKVSIKDLRTSQS